MAGRLRPGWSPKQLDQAIGVTVTSRSPTKDLRTAGNGGVLEPLLELEESIRIDAPVDAVWSLVVAAQRQPHFVGVKSITTATSLNATSEVTVIDPPRRLSWVSSPLGPERSGSEDVRVHWSYDLAPVDTDACELTHSMRLFPAAGATQPLGIMHELLNFPRQQRNALRLTLVNIKAAAEF